MLRVAKRRADLAKLSCGRAREGEELPFPRLVVESVGAATTTTAEQRSQKACSTDRVSFLLSDNAPAACLSQRSSVQSRRALSSDGRNLRLSHRASRTALRTLFQTLLVQQSALHISRLSRSPGPPQLQIILSSIR